MAEQIPVRAGFIEPPVACAGTLADRKGDGAVGELMPDLRDNLTEPVICEIPVLAALQDEGAEAQPISQVAAGEDVLFCQPVALCVCVAFADAAVVAVVFTVVCKFDQPADVDVMSVMEMADIPRQFKKMFRGAGRAFPDDGDPFIPLQRPGQAEPVDQGYNALFSLVRSHASALIYFFRRSSSCSRPAASPVCRTER